LSFFRTLRAGINPKEVALIVTGGEPLCHPELQRLLDVFQELGLAWGMVTNGYALTPQAVQRLVDANIYTATVSLDGLPASHDWLRGRDGSISACPNIDRELVQGNIRTDDFFEVWEKRFAPFRKRDWLRQGPCKDCHAFGRCQGNSLHLYDAQQGHTGRCTLHAVTT